MERLKGNDLMPGHVGDQIGATTSTALENFISTFNDVGVAQPNRYEVLLFPPRLRTATARVRWLAAARDIQLRCESVTLPGQNLSSTPDTNVHGPLREVVNNVNYADSVAMVFQASADLRERVFFENWQYTAFNKETWNVGYYNDYTGRVEIYILDKQNKRRYGLKLMECFPKSIGPTELSYASNNEILRLTIEMNFRYWETLDQNQETAQPRSGEEVIVSRMTNTPAVVKALRGGPGGN
jgi:hypothetical protein